MRLNRGTIIFFLILVVIIAAGYVLMNSDDTESDESTATPTVKEALFADIEQANITALTLSQQVPVEDTRPTPLPDEDPLPTLTPVPEGEDAPTQVEILSVVKDAGGNWVLTEESMLTSTSPVEIARIENALGTIVDAQAEAFVPESGDYTQYGLDNPEFELIFVVEATEEDGAEVESVTQRLRIGDRSFDNLGFYAFLDDDSETVYIISSASTFKTNVLDMMLTPPFAPTPTPVPPITVNVGGLLFSNLNPTTTSRIAMSDLETGESLVLVKQEDGINWAVEDGDPSRTVSQAKVTTAFIDMTGISVVSRTAIEDLSTVGLDNPIYTLLAEYTDGRTLEVSLGDKDPTGALYYSLVNDISDVILINAPEVDRLLNLIANPPYEIVEATPEATEEASVAEEMTPEMTQESSVEVEATPEMTAEAPVEEEMTPEATETSD